jgi:WD40 repeat protein
VAASSGSQSITGEGRIEVRATFRAHQRPFVTDLAFSPDGTQLASIGQGIEVKAWMIKDQQSLQTFMFNRPVYGYCNVAFSNDGKDLLVAAQRQKRLQGDSGWELWRCGLGKAGKELVRAWPKEDRVLALWPEHDTLVTTNDDPTNRVAPYGIKFVGLNGKGDTLVRAEAPLNVLTFSRNKKLVVFELDKGNIRVAEIATSRVVASFPSHPEGIASALLSADNKTLLTIPKRLGTETELCFWDVASGKRTGDGIIENGRLDQLADLAPDGRTVGVLRRGSVLLLDLKTRRFIASQRVVGGKFRCLRFAPDGKTFATGSEDGTVRIFAMPESK